MIDNLEQMNFLPFFVNRVEKKFIITKVEFPDALHVSFECMIAPLFSQDEPRRSVENGKEKGNFLCRTHHVLPSCSLPYLHCFQKLL